MPFTIDYYFICSSPFTYLGHKAFHEIAAEHGAKIAYKPVSLMGVWEKSGSVPLGKRTPTRQRYRLVELQRFAEWRGLPLNLQPKHFPVDPTLADRVAMVLAARGEDPAGYLWRAHSGVWANEENIADPQTLGEYLETEGFDANLILQAATGLDIAAAHERNTQDAIAADAIGVPTYVLGGEPFWGQDRIDLLDRALASGRQAFHA